MMFLVKEIYSNYTLSSIWVVYGNIVGHTTHENTNTKNIGENIVKWTLYANPLYITLKVYIIRYNISIGSKK